MATSNRERVGGALDLLGQALDPFVQRVVAHRLPEGKDWTLLLVAKDGDRATGKEYSRSDVYLQLRALTEKLIDGWFPFDDHLSRAEKTLASELREVRHRWAHNQSFSGDDAYRALDTIERLLRAVDATQQADEVRTSRLAMQREQYETEVRRSARSQPSLPPLESTGLPPWREVLRPHPDVESGDYAASEFAADLFLVAQRQAEREYNDPVEFFRRTYLTDGLRDLLGRAAARVTGDPNASPVVNLQTNFGGGKTHSMLAVWHLFSGAPVTEFPQEVQDVVGGHDLSSLGTVNRVAIVGNEIPAGQPVCKDDGTEVHTIWGELAWQLGGREGYDMVAQADRTATSPGALDELFRRFGPAVVLIDEWVSYARQLHSRDDLCGGTFDTQFSFAQALTEAAKRVPGTLLLVSIPSSDVRRDAEGEAHDSSDLEIGGTHGREALHRLQNVVGRLADQWRPASSQESFEIVRRRLFLDPGPDARTKIGVTAKKFREFYAEHRGEFPRETGEPPYEDRIKQAYPIHPELFDRLYEDWSSLERFQRTRGVLRLMSGVVHELWKANDQAPLIMPGSLPLDALRVRDELSSYLEDRWKPVIDADIDGSDSTPARIDDERPLFGKRALTRRIARTVFLGSAPRLQTAHKGLEKQHVFLGVAQPGDTVGNFGSSLQMLGDRATYFYADGDAYWFDLQQSLNRMARDYAEGLHDEDVWAEIVERLGEERRHRGEFAEVVVAPESSAEVNEADVVRLVLLHPRFVHSRSSTSSSAYEFVHEMVGNRGNSPREKRNTIVALAPDHQRVEELTHAVRTHLAWRRIADRINELDLTQQQTAQVRRYSDETSKAVDQRIPACYIWALFPDQPDGSKPFRISAQKIEGSESRLAVRVGKRLADDDVLRPRTAYRNIRMDLDRHLRSRWNDGRISFGELWDYYTKYPYLPRLRDRSVLETAVRDAVRQFDVAWVNTGFAIAQSYDSTTGDFHGLTVPGDDHELGPMTDSTLVVAPGLAETQRERERERALEQQGSSQLEEPPAAGETLVVEPVQASQVRPSGRTTSAEPAAATPTRNVRYEARADIDPTGDIEQQLVTLAREVLAHLAQAEPDVLDISVEVASDRSDGFDERTVRTVAENARTLKFSRNRFEDE